MYQPEKTKAFYWTLRTLQLIFVVPTSFEKSYLYRFYMKNILLKSCAVICYGVLTISHLIYSIKHRTGADISEGLCITLGGMTTVVTTSLVAFKYELWSSLFLNLEKCGEMFGNKSALEKRIKVLNFYSLFYTIYICTGLSIHAIINARKRSDCYKLVEETGVQEICGTFIPLKLPFEVSPLGSSLIFAAQFLITIIFFPSGALICFMVYEATDVIICYYQQLNDYFEHMFDGVDEEQRREKLWFCIHYHNHLLGLTKQLNIVVKHTTGQMSLICAIVFGAIGNLIFKAPLSGILFLAGYVAALFAICHAGQKLMDKTLLIGDAVYRSKWYDVDVKTMKDIAFILARTQEPMLLDALPLGSFNYPLFLLILKTSYTYLTLLQQTT